MSTNEIEVDLGENPDLKEVIAQENELKEFVVQYVGAQTQPESGEVTIEMVIETFMKEFPEFLLPIAEENWIRGYHQALADVEEGEKLADSEEAEAEEDGA